MGTAPLRSVRRSATFRTVPPHLELEAFLLTRQWRDTPSGIAYELWAASARGPVRISITGQEGVLFVPRDVATSAGRRDPVEMTTLEGVPVDAVYFRSQRDLRAERERLRRAGHRTLEGDLKPVDRFTMERFITGGLVVRGAARERDGFLELRDPQIRSADEAVPPPLRVTSLDIETDGYDGALLSIATITGDRERVLVCGRGPDDPRIAYFDDERALLAAFVDELSADDPDAIAGWNVVEYDLRLLCERARQLGVSFAIGRARERADVLAPRAAGQPHVARVPGRVVLDGILTMRSAAYGFESFRLEDVAAKLLGRGKAIDAAHGEARIAEIRRLHREDPRGLAEYNLEDCRLVLDVFAHANLVGFAVERQRLTGLPMDRPGGSVAAFDYLYLPRLHRHGHVAPDVGDVDEIVASPGGVVLESRPGLYDHVLVLDFKSLYPSIIRTFRIDPMGLAFPGDDPVPGFEGAEFARDRHILPGLIETLWAARDRAKRDGDTAMSTAIKILMNSFYGVLGTPGCRFFDPRLASSITLRGHEIITRSRAWIEERFPVIYGDTDSLFVHVGASVAAEDVDRVGGELASGLNAMWRETLAREHRIESALEIQYETHYLRFLMPTLRHSERGTKKRYAGSVRRRDGSTHVVVKGLEAVRTDWTPLARRFQRELLRRVFAGEPWEAWMRAIADDVRAGRLDEELVYRKRLRRPLDAYSESGAPAHVKAARRLGTEEEDRREVRYVMTRRGPEPVESRTAAIDYEHYVEKQLAPAADVVLSCLGTDFAGVAGRQLSLF